MNPVIISFCNFKGGIGKSTTCKELGFYLASRNYKVLLIDCDAQGNLSKGLLDEEESYTGLEEALEGKDYQVQEVDENLWIIPSDFRLTTFNQRLMGELDAYIRLKELLQKKQFKDYDFILLDCPPSLTILASNALVTSNYIVIPMNTTLFALQGCNDLMETIAKIKRSFNPKLNILGVVIGSYDKRPVINREIKNEIKDTFKQKVFETPLSKSVRFEEATAQKTSVIHMKGLGRSRAKKEVESLGNEFLSCSGLLPGILTDR